MVQVEPMNPMLKPPGTQCLKLKHDDPLSTFAVNFSMRRYSEVNAYGIDDNGESYADITQTVGIVG